MLTAQRKQALLTRLAREGRLVAKSLAEELGLSEDTLRRDLRELAAAGLLQRVHGGALPASAAVADLQVRVGLSTAQKVTLGRFAAAMIRPGQIVFLDGGTTTLEVARQLPLDLRATLITHSPTIAVELARHPDIEILVLGGRLFRHSMVQVGAEVIAAAARIRPDLFFLGVTGIHPEAGLTTGDAEEAAVKRALLGRAADTVVLASAEKLMAASPYTIAALSEISSVVVTGDAPASAVAALRGSGVAVIQAAPA